MALTKSTQGSFECYQWIVSYLKFKLLGLDWVFSKSFLVEVGGQPGPEGWAKFGCGR